MADPISKEVYIGDGLYACYDGMQDHIRLRAPRAGNDHWVALEVDVFKKLVHFAETVWGPVWRAPVPGGGVPPTVD